MFEQMDINNELERVRRKTRSGGEQLVNEAARILKKDLFTESNILENLKQYIRNAEVIDEEDVESERIYTTRELKRIAVLHRLKFLESKKYKPDIPYEVVLKIKHLNGVFKKDLRSYHVLSLPAAFTGKDPTASALLFVKTNYDNYYLLHSWGNKVSWWRRLQFWPLRNFENLFITLLAVTLTITLSLPTHLISLDPKAVYWSGYRAAAFFHLLIFNMGVTAYFTFAFSKNFSSSTWNREKDFD